MSVTLTPVASDGPLFAANRVKVTVVPTLGVLLLAVPQHCLPNAAARTPCVHIARGGADFATCNIHLPPGVLPADGAAFFDSLAALPIC